MAVECGEKIMELYRQGIKARKVVSLEGFYITIRYCMATGGSTNSLLHIPAIAGQAGFKIQPSDFDRISAEIPVISTIYPNKKEITMKEFSEAGGLPAVVKALYNAGKFTDLSLIHILQLLISETGPKSDGRRRAAPGKAEGRIVTNILKGGSKC